MSDIIPAVTAQETLGTGSQQHFGHCKLKIPPELYQYIFIITITQPAS